MGNKRKWIVKVPITLEVCVQVTAPNKQAAIEAANEAANDLVPLYDGSRYELSRPSMVGINYDGDDCGAWFDDNSLDQADLFLKDGVTAERI